MSANLADPTFVLGGQLQPVQTQAPFPLPSAPFPTGLIQQPSLGLSGYTSGLPPVPHHGVMGFFENLAGDVKDFAAGITSVIGMGVHDAAKLATFGQLGGGFETPKLIGGLAHLPSTYAQYYGHDLLGHVYEHPLQIISDIASVATLGGTAAAKAAEVSAGVGKILGLGGEASEIGQTWQAASRAAKMLEGVEKVTDPLRQAKIIGQASDIGKALGMAPEELTVDGFLTKAEEAGAAFRDQLPNWVKYVLPGIGTTEGLGGARSIMAVGENAPKITSFAENPVTRFFQQKWDRVLTEPVSNIADRMAEIKYSAVDDPELQRLQHIVDTANRYGVTRLQKPVVSNFILKRMVDEGFGGITDRFINVREDFTNALQNIYHGLSGGDLSMAHWHFKGYDSYALGWDRSEFDQIVGRDAKTQEALLKQQDTLSTKLEQEELGPVEAKATQQQLDKVGSNLKKLEARMGKNNPEYWNKLLDQQETLSSQIAYGTAPDEQAARVELGKLNDQLRSKFTPVVKIPAPDPTAIPLASRSFDIGVKHAAVDHYPTEEFPPLSDNDYAKEGIASFKDVNAALDGGARTFHKVVRAPMSNDPLLLDSKAQVVVDAVAPTWNDVAAARDKLDSLGTVVRVDDHVRNPQGFGYRGVNVDIVRPSGNMIQVRLHTPESFAAHSGTPALFNAFRGLQANHDALLATLERAKAPVMAGAEGATDATKAVEEIKAMLGPMWNPEIEKTMREMMGVQDPAVIAALEQRAAESAKSMEKAQALISSRYEPVIQQLDEQVDGRVVSPLERSREQTRTLMGNTVESKNIEMGLLDIGDAFDRQFMPLREATGAVFNKKTGEWERGMDPLDIYRSRQAQGLHTPLYFPDQDARGISRSDFLMSRQRIGGKSAARQKALRQNQGAVMKQGTAVLNPLEVYARRGAQTLRQVETYNFFRWMLDTFGRPVNSAIDVSREQEMLVAPEGLLHFFQARIKLGDWLSSTVNRTLDDTLSTTAHDALARGLEEVLPEVQDQVKSYIATARNRNLVAVPKIVARRIEDYSRFRMGAFGRTFWQTPTQVWRNLVLFGSPRFALKKLLGDVVLLKTQGGRLSDVIRQLDQRFRDEVVSVLPKDVGQGLFQSMSQGYTIKRGEASDVSMVAKGMDTLANSLPMKGLKAYGGFFKRVVSATDEAFRRASYLTAADQTAMRQGIYGTANKFIQSDSRLQRIAEVGLTPQLAHESVNIMHQFFANYSKLGPLEKNVIRPYIAPFWTFYKHIGKMVLTMPIKLPARFDALRNLASVGNEITGGFGAVPSYLKGDVPLGAGSQPGDTRFLTSMSPFNDVFKSPVSLLHPALKSLLEYMTGRNLVSGSAFSAPNVIEDPGTGKMYQVDAYGRATPIDAVRPSLLELLARSFPQYQMAEDLAAGGGTYGTATLPSILSERLGGLSQTGPIELIPQNKPGGGQIRYPTDTAGELLSLGGLGTTTFNIPEFQNKLLQGERQAVATYQRRLGLIP